MKIGIDARVLDRRITGTGRFLLNLINEIPNIDSKNEYYLFTKNPEKYNTNFYKIIKYNDYNLPQKLYTPYWINIKIPKLINQNKLDIVFFPNVFAPIIKVKDTKYISVIHDIISKISKDYHPFIYRVYKRIMLPLTIKNSDKVLTVSNYSREQIINEYKVPENNIKVIYNSYSKNLKNKVEVPKELEHVLNDKYILFVGAVEKRKNVETIIETVDRVRTKFNLKLVIVGKKGYKGERIIKKIKSKRDYIFHFENVSDKQLSVLYQNAFLFFFPSFMEGFGIPPLEAMYCGCPVLSSNTTSLKEVVGSGGIMHAPDDITSFEKEIIELYNDEAKYYELKKKAKNQSEKFRIEDITQKLVNIFEELKVDNGK